MFEMVHFGLSFFRQHMMAPWPFLIWVMCLSIAGGQNLLSMLHVAFVLCMQACAPAVQRAVCRS